MKVKSSKINQKNLTPGAWSGNSPETNDFKQVLLGSLGNHGNLLNKKTKEWKGKLYHAHYQIIEKIAEGGMGLVYKALDLQVQRIVALKILPASICKEEELKKDFIKEGELIAQINHPFIGSIYEIVELTNGSLFMVMPFYGGKTLRQKMHQKRLSFDQVLQVIKQVACGLGEVHGHGIVHQDIKPDNIIINGKNTIKIIDFGIAKLVETQEKQINKLSMGTAAYMSPEQTCGAFVDCRTDIWTLGVVLYEMLNGNLPFQGVYEQEIAYAILNEPPAAMNGIPPRLQRIVHRCLSKNPDRRYSRMQEFLTDIIVFEAREKIKKQLAVNASGKQKVREWYEVA